MRRLLLSFASSLLVAGCTGQTSSVTVSDPQPPAPTSHQVSGRASAGPMVDATLEVFALDAAGEVTASLGSVRTDAGGSFALDVVADANDSLALVATGGTYDEEATGTAVPLSQPVRLLIGAAAATDVGVTPLTEIATQRALATVAGSTSLAEAVRNAHYAVAQAVGLADITRAPADPRQPVADPTSQGAKYALVLAGISQLATAHGVDSVSLTLALATGFAQSGSLDPDPASAAAILALPNGTTVVLPATAWSVGLPAAVTTFLQGHGSATGLTVQSLTVITAQPPLVQPPPLPPPTPDAPPPPPPPAPPSLISLSLADERGGSLAAGTVDGLGVQGVFSDGSQRSLAGAVTWSSGSPDVAAVSPAGVVTGLHPGTAVITATAGALTASLTLVVRAADLVDLTLSSTAGTTVPAGVGGPVQVVGTFTDGTHQPLVSEAHWTSSDASIAAVAAAPGPGSGYLLATHAAGTVVLTASVGGVSQQLTLVVTAATPVSLAVGTAGGAAAAIAAGTSLPLTVTALYTDGSTQDRAGQATWSSADATVATVNSAGVVRGVAVGSVAIHATVGNLSAALTVQVTAATLTSIAVTGAQATPIPAGTSTQLTVRATYSDGSQQDVTAQAAYTSSDPGLAGVTAAGLVQSHALGSVTVHVVFQAATTDFAQAIVAAAPQSLAVVSAAGAQVAKGLTSQLHATVTYTDSSTADVTAQAVWSSDTPAAVTVDAAGLATAAAVGTSSLSAAALGLNAALSLEVLPAQRVSLAISSAGSFSVAAGQTDQLAAEATYTDQTTSVETANVTWSSSDPSVATVDANGLLTAGATPGTSDIGATLGGVVAPTQTETVTP